MDKTENILPKSWELISLGEILEELYRYPTYYNIEYADQGVPEIRGEFLLDSGEIEKDKTKYRFISKETSSSFPKTILKKGDFVMSVRGTMGKIGIVRKNFEGANITANLIKISLDRKKCFPEYFKYYFTSRFFQNELQRLSPNTTIKTIQVPLLRSIKLLLPSIQEQEPIANILSSVDEAIQKADEAITKTERIKQAMMQKLLSEGIGHKEFKQTKIGKIPKDWEILTLGSITLNITDGKHGDCQNEACSGYYFISAKDIYDSKINYDNARQITQKDFEDAHKRTKLEPNDILLTNSGSIGKTALIDFSEISKRTTFQKSVAIIKVKKENVHPTFLLHYLANLQSYLTSLASGTSQKNLLLKDLRALLIPVPSISEQLVITDTLQNFNLKFLLAKNRKAKLERIKQGLMEDLLTGKKKVKIN